MKDEEKRRKKIKRSGEMKDEQKLKIKRRQEKK